MVSYAHAVYVTCVSALGCREVGFYCDTWVKYYSQLILPKNLDQLRQFRRAPFRRTVVSSPEGKRTERFSEKSLNLENSLKSEVRLPSSKETLQLQR
jgi:hypothetical protein